MAINLHICKIESQVCECMYVCMDMWYMHTENICINKYMCVHL